MPMQRYAEGTASRLKEGAKRGLRSYGVATAPLRALPDFLIIGAKRAATTTLWNSVVGHPNILPMFPAKLKTKGTGYFSINHQRGTAWYRSFFPLTATLALNERRDGIRPQTGEATPYYLFHPLAPSRTKELLPSARLVVILRNPVDRAYSHYRERVRHGVERLSFEDALDAEDARLAGEEERIVRSPGYNSFAHEHLSYARQGRYVDMFLRWLACFEREQLLVILNEDFDEHPGRELRRVWDFLGLPPWDPPEVARYNYHPGEPMASDTRERLLRAFATPNDELAQLLGMDLSAWRT